MARVLFVDDRLDEVLRQWHGSGCAGSHELLLLEPFTSVADICRKVNSLKPDVVLIGFGLGVPEFNGADLIKAIRQAGYTGRVIANSGDPGLFSRAGVEVDGSANRSPGDLKVVLEKLT